MKIRTGSFFLVFKKARLILAVLALAVVAGTLIFLSKERAMPRAKNTPPPGQGKEIGQFDRDSEHNLFQNWQAKIFGTNPGGADQTALNQSEINQNSSFILNPTSPSKNSQDFSPNNLTQRLAENFGGQFIIPKLTDPSLQLNSQDVGNQVVENTLQNQPTFAIKVFTEKDLTVSQDNNMAAFNKYLAEFNKIYVDAFRGLDKSELVIFSEAMQAEDLSKLSALDPYIAAYDKVIKNSLKLPAPSEIAKLHLEYLNLTAQQAELVKKMRRAETDAVTAVYAAQNFMSLNQEVQDLGDRFARKFISLGVTSS